MGLLRPAQANRELDAAAGISTYQWVADTSFMDEIQADGQFWMIQIYQSLQRRQPDLEGHRPLHDGRARHAVRRQPVRRSGSRQETIIRNQNCVTHCPDGLPLYADYGKGVMLWQTDAVASRWINGTAAFGRYQDIVHDDVYWFTDPYVCWSESEGPRFYGQGSALPTSTGAAAPPTTATP